MVQIRRVLAVTGGLILTGALAGAVLGALILGGGVLVMDGFRGARPFVPILGLGAAVGGVIGAVLAPVTAWVLLRSVPLGRAVLETALGTMIGATVMWFVPAVGPLFGGVLGFGVAAAHLDVVARRRRAAEQRLGAPPG